MNTRRPATIWKAVDDVVRIVKNVSMREWPNVPPIWQSIISGHWLVKVWNKNGIDRISTESVPTRTCGQRLPQLFTEFAQWDKSSSKFTRGKKKEFGLPPWTPGNQEPTEPNERAGPRRVQPTELWPHANKTIRSG